MSELWHYCIILCMFLILLIWIKEFLSQCKPYALFSAYGRTVMKSALFDYLWCLVSMLSGPYTMIDDLGFNNWSLAPPTINHPNTPCPSPIKTEITATHDQT